MSIIVVDRQKMVNLRVRAGFTQNSLAKASGTSSALISRVESGSTNLRPSNAIKICRALGVEFDEVFSLSEQNRMEVIA